MEEFRSKKSERHVTTQMIEEQLVREQELTWTGAAPWVFAIVLVLVMWFPMFRAMAMSVLALFAVPAVVVAVVVGILIAKERTGWALTKAQAARNQAGGNDVR